MADIQINITDNSEATLQEFERATQAALEACGQQAASHAKQNLTAAGRVDTGALRNSVNSAVSGKAAYVGTNMSYAKFHEMGTGIYIAGGRKSPWAYQDNKGNWHRTRGVSPIHFIKNAVADHVAEYKRIIQQYLSRP